MDILVRKQAHEPLQHKRDHRHVIQVHLFTYLFHFGVALRMSQAQHLVKYSHIGHDSIHTGVIIGWQKNFGNSFENKEGLLAAKTVINQECYNRVHALTVPDVRVVSSKHTENLFSFKFDLGYFISSINIFLYNSLKL